MASSWETKNAIIVELFYLCTSFQVDIHISRRTIIRHTVVICRAKASLRTEFEFYVMHWTRGEIIYEQSIKVYYERR